MKKEKVASIQKYFIDFEGNCRLFTIAAVSVISEGITALDFTTLSIGSDDTVDIVGESIDKKLLLGVSVQRKGDEEDRDLGLTIAIGKAKKDKTRIATLYSTDSGLINSKMVSALLEQEAEFFINNPGKYLKGYNKDKEKYLASKEADAK